MGTREQDPGPQRPRRSSATIWITDAGPASARTSSPGTAQGGQILRDLGGGKLSDHHRGHYPPRHRENGGGLARDLMDGDASEGVAGRTDWLRKARRRKNEKR